MAEERLKKFSLKKIAHGLGSLSEPLSDAAIFLGADALLKDFTKSQKEKILKEEPRGKFLSVFMQISPEAQAKLIPRFKKALKKHHENDLVANLCKLENAQKEVEDQKTKKKVMTGSYKEALEQVALLPDTGPGLTFDIAIELLTHDKWKQLAQRGIDFVTKDAPKKIKEEINSSLNDFADDLQNLNNELDELF